MSHLLPDKCSEKLIRCYCKKRDESSIEHATKAFKEWREQHCCTVGGKDLLSFELHVHVDYSISNKGALDIYTCIYHMFM